jgi:hypothetical protein
MSYSYQVERRRLFTEDGQATFITVRDTCRRLIEKSGACQSMNAGRDLKGYDAWELLACLDLMVERGELRYVQGPENAAGQDWTYIAGPEWRNGVGG